VVNGGIIIFDPDITNVGHHYYHQASPHGSFTFRITHRMQIFFYFFFLFIANDFVIAVIFISFFYIDLLIQADVLFVIVWSSSMIAYCARCRAFFAEYYGLEGGENVAFGGICHSSLPFLPINRTLFRCWASPRFPAAMVLKRPCAMLPIYGPTLLSLILIQTYFQIYTKFFLLVDDRVNTKHFGKRHNII
jgi:hypothetical protein